MLLLNLLKKNILKRPNYMDEGQIDGKVVRVEILSPKNYIKLKQNIYYIEDFCIKVYFLFFNSIISLIFIYYFHLH